MKNSDFTKGGIALPLMRFALPVLAAMLLQSAYGAVDLLVVGRFAGAGDVSAVSTGAQVMSTVTSLIVGLSTGLTVLLGQRIGQNDRHGAGEAVGAGIVLFAALAVALTVLVIPFTEPLCRLMQAPEEAFSQTADYVRICSVGLVFIVAFNVLGGVFRGIGNARMPLFSVAVACVTNIFGDLAMVAGLQLGAAGAAIATVGAQGVSVIICFLVLRRQKLPFEFEKSMIKADKDCIKSIVRIGTPLALQDVLVSFSFLAVMSIVNSQGVIASAGVGVADRICGFVMLIPSAFSQAMTAFVAQNWGARKITRAKKTMRTGIFCALLISIPFAYLGFFQGKLLCGIFAKDADIIQAGAEYLKAFAIDTMLTSILFCMIGFFSGCGYTTFSMAQGIFGAFCVRIPVAYLVSRQEVVSLFHLGLATPCSTVVQILLCVGYYCIVTRKMPKDA